MMSSLPLHPVVNHFPVVGVVLAAVCLLLRLLRPRAEGAEWLTRSLLLLVVGLVAMPLVFWSGWKWAVSMGLWPSGNLLPPRNAQDGLLMLHIVGGCVSTFLLVAGLFLGLAHRRGRAPFWPFLLLILVSALAIGMTAHVGGQMVFGSPSAEVGGP